MHGEIGQNPQGGGEMGVGEEALADLIVGLLHENNGHMHATIFGQHLYNLDPAYKPLLKRSGGLKGLCSRHSERLQYEGNAGGGVVRLGSGKIHVSPKQQIREEQEAPLLPAIIEGGAGSDPELDRPSGAADALGPLPPPTVGEHADTEGDGVQASALLKDVAVEIAAQLEGSAVHKKMLHSLELAGTIGLTTNQLMATKAIKNAWVFKNALKAHGLQGSQVSPARVFAQLSGIKCQKFNPGGMKFFKCVPNDEGARGILPHNSVEHDAVPAIEQIDMMQQRQQGGDAPAAGTQPSFPKPARVEPMTASTVASVELMPANTAASIKALRDVARLFRGRVWPNTKAQVKSAIASLYREHPAWLWEWIPRESKLDNCNEEKQIKNMAKIFKEQWGRLGVLSGTKKKYTWNTKMIEHLLEKDRTQMEGDGGPPKEATRPVATSYRLATGEDVELVQSAQRLQQLLASDTALRGDSDSVVALDCEGVPESLHLIQLATRERVVVLDGIKLGQKEMCESLAPLLTSKRTVKLIHDLHKDAAAFATIGGVEMSNCLDSQLAMELISQKLHMGLNEMLKQLGCTLHLSKRDMKERMASDSSKTVFSQRPLPRNVIEYAAMDVTLLLSAHERSHRLPCFFYSLTPDP